MKRIMSIIALVALAGCVTVQQEPPVDLAPVFETVDAVAAYEATSDGELLYALYDDISTLSNHPQALAKVEAKLIKHLKNPDTDFLAVQAICDVLGVMGTDASVPALATLLTKDKKYADAARLALQRIPGPEADQALKDALASGNAANPVGIKNTLEARSQ